MEQSNCARKEERTFSCTGICPRMEIKGKRGGQRGEQMQA